MDHGLTSVGVTTVVWLLVVILVVALVSRRIRIPYTAALVIAGLITALTPINLSVELTPDIILLIFLPALLFESSYNLHFPDVRDNLRPITLLAVPGVIATAAGVAAITHIATGVSWETAFLFGAIMSATDPVSVLAIFRQIGAPRRLSVILESESLFNDGTSLVIFRIVLGIVVAHRVGEVAPTIGQFVLVIVGALVLGAIIGYSASLLLTRVNDYLVETALTLLVAYGTYIAAEQLGVSGVIAVVVAALVVGNYGRNTAMTPTTRLAVSSTWEFFGFLANSLIFLLIGLEVHAEKLQQYWLPTLLAIITVLVVRVVLVWASSILLRYIHRPLPAPWQAVLVWGGLRGSLALAMALSLPFSLVPEVPPGTGLVQAVPFPDRDLLQVMTFGVILFSLLVQGLTMKPLLARLGLISSSTWRNEYETIGVRKGMAAAAIAEIERLSKSGGLSPEDAKELLRAYHKQIDDSNSALAHIRVRDEDIHQEQLRLVKRRLIQAEKNAIQERRLEGRISEEPAQEVLAQLDDQLHALDEDRDPTALGKWPEPEKLSKPQPENAPT